MTVTYKNFREEFRLFNWDYETDGPAMMIEFRIEHDSNTGDYTAHLTSCEWTDRHGDHQLPGLTHEHICEFAQMAAEAFLKQHRDYIVNSTPRFIRAEREFEEVNAPLRPKVL